MQDVIQALQANRTGFLATVEQGQPRTRPFEFQFEEHGKFFFCTATTKDVYQQLQRTPYVEFATASPNKQWLTVRLRGNVEFSDDRGVKERIINTNALVRSIYKTPDNPAFAIFYIEHGQAVMFDFSGNPPRTFQF